LTEPAADVLRAAYTQAMTERRDVIDLAVVKEAAAVARGALLENLGGAKPGTPGDSGRTGASATADAPELREARWSVRRDAGFAPADPLWSAAVAGVLPELVRRLPGAPHTPVISGLGPLGALHEPKAVARWASGVVGKLLMKSDRAGGPVLVALEMEASRQAVLLGRPVDTAAVVLAVLSLDEHLAAAGRELRARYRPGNEGGTVLRARGLTLGAAQTAAFSVPEESELSPRQLAWGHTAADPAWTTAAAGVWDAAGELSRQEGAPGTGTSHLVRALDLVDVPAAASLLK
jgi:hypothetical protein